MEAYTNISYADAYFATRLKHLIWDEATVDSKVRSLFTASAAINRLNYSGDKYSTTQELEFPRGTDVQIPEQIQQACCEEAYSLLDGRDAEMEMNDFNSTESTFGNVKSTHDTSVVPENTVHGITSVIAWNLIRPFLRDPRTVLLSRIN